MPLPNSFFLISSLFLVSCSVQNKINRTARATVLKDSALKHAHIGISIYDPASGKYLYNHNGTGYFVPASNTKIITCYAAMKYLGDSLAGIRYSKTEAGTVLFPTGDPTFLHADYSRQPVLNFLQAVPTALKINNDAWKTTAFGSGWSWNDFNFYYMTERSSLPVYGNNIQWIQEIDSSASNPEEITSPTIYSNPEVNWKVRFNTDTSSKVFYVQREKEANVFTITEGRERKKEQWVPFVTNGIQSSLELLKEVAGKEIQPVSDLTAGSSVQTIWSQPLDSVLKPMMHRSDNFFAEQLLLMVSNERFKVFNEDKLIDTLLATDLKGFPQKPYWADGSGLSRYNLFTPQDFIFILGKMKDEFGMDRLKEIFPTGGKGTLASYYRQDSSFIYAKTGSLSGVLALSGYMYTAKGRLLTFSVIINNHRTNAAQARRRVESFLTSVRKSY